MTAVIISRPQLSDSWSAALTGLDHNPAAVVDSAKRPVSDVERLLTIVAAIADADIDVGFHKPSHASLTLLVVADAYLSGRVIQHMGGMTVTLADTKRSDMVFIVATGTLEQWRNSVMWGMKELQASQVFRDIHSAFIADNIDMWKDIELPSPILDI